MKFRLILFFLLFVNFLTAQDFTQTIRGTVVDKASGMSIPGANVIISNSNPLIGTTTDMDGKFRLEKVKIGRIDLKVSYIGYNDAFLYNLQLNTGKELVLSVEMEEKVEAMNEVVVSAKVEKMEPINKMATISARGFTVDETEQYAGARSDVGRMASNYAGVVGNNDARNDIVIRGNSPSGLLWRLEGVDIPNPNHFAAFGTTGGPICMLKNSMLSNSDFYTSAFPAEFGNALSGVFDLKMRKGNNEQHEFMAQFGFNGLELGAEGPVSRKNGSSYLLDYSYSALDFFSKFNIEFGTGIAIPKYQDMAFKLNFPKTPVGQVSLFGFGGFSNIALQDSKKDTTKQKIDFYGSEGWDIINYSATGVVGLTDNYILNSKTYIRLTVAEIYHDFKVQKDSVTPYTLNTVPYERSLFAEQKTILNFLFNKKLNASHIIRSGINTTWIHNNLTDSLFFPAYDKFRKVLWYNGTTCLLQPYFEWQYKILNNLTFTPGLHYQYLFYNNTGSLEPRLGIKWSFSPTQSLSAGYGMHSQIMPASAFYRQVELPGGTYAKPNDKLGFLRSSQFVIGYDWNVSEYRRLKAEIYYQKITNVPVDAAKKSYFSVLNLGANFELWSPDSLKSTGTGNNYGLELTFEQFIHKGYYFLLTTSIYDSKYKGSDGIERNTVFNGNFAANLLLGKEIVFKSKKVNLKRQKSLIINLKSTYSGGQRYVPIDLNESISQQYTVYNYNNAYADKYTPYSRTDLKISFKMNGKKFTVEQGMELMNMFNQKNIYNQYFNKRTKEVYYTYQLGRTFMLQYKITF